MYLAVVVDGHCLWRIWYSPGITVYQVLDNEVLYIKYVTVTKVVQCSAVWTKFSHAGHTPFLVEGVWQMGLQRQLEVHLCQQVTY